MKAKIKLMRDYCCHPLWWCDEEKIGNINPETLPLQQDTINRLQAYAKQLDDSLNWDYPPDTLEPTSEEKETIEKEGLSLWQQLKQELFPKYEVVYFSEKLQKVVTNIRELETEKKVLIS